MSDHLIGNRRAFFRKTSAIFGGAVLALPALSSQLLAGHGCWRPRWRRRFAGCRGGTFESYHSHSSYDSWSCSSFSSWSDDDYSDSFDRVSVHDCHHRAVPEGDASPYPPAEPPAPPPGAAEPPPAPPVDQAPPATSVLDLLEDRGANRPRLASFRRWLRGR